MTTTEIRQALNQVQHAVPVPPVDDLAFRARVRAERRRRLAVRGVAAVTAAAALTVGGVSAAHVLERGTGSRAPVASTPATPAAAGSVSETVWFVRDGRLTALDPSGTLHPTDVRSEGVIGFTTERVYALDDDSHVVVLDREHDEEGLGHDTGYPEGESPVPGAVQSVAMSADGRYLAWVDLENRVTVYDLLARRVDFRLDASSTTYVAGVSAEGVLLAENSGLVLRTATGQTAVPTVEADDTWGAQVAMGHVLVPGHTGRTSLYDLRSGRAHLMTTLPGGSAALAPAGEAAPGQAGYSQPVATIETARDDASAVVDLWDGERTRRLRGLEGVPEQVRFVDEQTLLVATGGGSAALWSCSTADLTCSALPVPDGKLRLLR